MPEHSTNDEQEKKMEELQQHLSNQSDGHKDAAIKMQSGQAQKLMSDLASTTSSDSIERLSVSEMNKQDEILASQSRTQIMHDTSESHCKTRANVRTARNTVQDKLVPHTDCKSRTPVDNTHNRDERIKKMEGPADTAKELANKLTYFTYYELLYVDDAATTEEIHTAYVKRTTEIRARFRSGIQEWRLNEFLRALHEAHSVLTDDKLRTEYDARIAAGEWEGSFQDLLKRIPDYRGNGHWAGSNSLVSLRHLLLAAGFVTQLELEEYGVVSEDAPTSSADGPELAQILADAGLITFEELASVLLGKALIDRRQITVDQFKMAVRDMREHSHKLVDALINQGWLTPSELTMIDLA